ncbi:hypothetical protein [Staphylococcus canis]|uniref:Uncharacterized protein n=1 Tax=Staphylococcus canis TaxID=2724942 RepID=A0ABS0T7I4_9STAP|nr:hypothetical protein [Staphylococcus canis]MBI5974637.1 hypothetical protein [Staphylococcus canis]
MRNIILILFSIINLVGLILTFQTLGIDYLSIRILIVALTTVLSVYLILLYQTRTQRILALFSLSIALVHVVMLVRAVYLTLYH